MHGASQQWNIYIVVREGGCVQRGMAEVGGRPEDMSAMYLRRLCAFQREIRGAAFPEDGLTKKHRCGSRLSKCGFSQADGYCCSLIL